MQVPYIRRRQREHQYVSHNRRYGVSVKELSRVDAARVRGWREGVDGVEALPPGLDGHALEERDEDLSRRFRQSPFVPHVRAMLLLGTRRQDSA